MRYLEEGNWGGEGPAVGEQTGRKVKNRPEISFGQDPASDLVVSSRPKTVFVE